MPVPPLKQLARTRLIQNIHMLEDIGDLPYSFLAPILRQIQNPAQLMLLETNCPQVIGETGEIWLRFIKRDIPGWDKKPHEPRDPRNWSKVYKKLKKEAEKEAAAQEEELRKKMQALQKDRNVHQTTIVNTKLHLPSARRSGFPFGSGRSGWGDPAAPRKTGKASFDKFRREIYDAKKANPKASMMPQHILEQRKKTITQVPARMVRLAELEAQEQAPRRMPAPKEALASASVASSSRKPPTARPQSSPRSNNTAPEKAPHSVARLPAGQQFSVPRLGPRPQQTAPSQPLKRPRTEHSVLVQPKRRKV